MASIHPIRCGPASHFYTALWRTLRLFPAAFFTHARRVTRPYQRLRGVLFLSQGPDPLLALLSSVFIVTVCYRTRFLFPFSLPSLLCWLTTWRVKLKVGQLTNLIKSIKYCDAFLNTWHFEEGLIFPWRRNDCLGSSVIPVNGEEEVSVVLSTIIFVKLRD